MTGTCLRCKLAATVYCHWAPWAAKGWYCRACWAKMREGAK